MDNKPSILSSVLQTLSKRGPAQTVAVLILAMLIAVSALLLLLTQIELGRIQNDVKAIDTSASDLEQVSRIADITKSGWMAESGGSIAHMNSLMNFLKQNTCCTLESDFAVPSLDWLQQAQLDISLEKQQISGMPIQGEDSRKLQDEVVNVYGSTEQLARTVSGVIADWNSYFGTDRDQRIQDAQAAILTSQKQFRDMQGRLDQAISGSLQKNSRAGSQSAALKASIPAVQTRSYLSIGGIGLGVVLFGGLVVLLNRSHMPVTKPSTPKTASSRTQDKRKRLRKK